MPAGVHGERRVDAHHQPTEVDRVQPVGVLGRVETQQHRLVGEVRRERVLQQAGVDRVVGVELVDDRVQVGRGGVGPERDTHRGDAELGAVVVLHGDVLGARAVVADQQRAEPGVTPRSARRAMRPTSSALISAAAAFPSSLRAVMDASG